MALLRRYWDRGWLPAVLLWLATVAAVLTSGVHYATGDAATEFPYIVRVAQSGWNIHQFGNNASSVITSVVAPFLVRTFAMTPLAVYTTLFVTIFAATPVLLYTLYRRVLPSSLAFLSALFFIVTPPTYQEVPTRGKSMIAEPLAVAVILILLSRLSNYWKAPLVLVLTGLVLVSHYTIGIFLLVWLGVFAVLSKSQLSAGIALSAGVLFFLVFFSTVGGGAIMHGLRYWDNLPGNHDVIQDVILGGSGNESAVVGTVYPIAQFGSEQAASIVSFAVPLWAQRFIIYLTFAVLAVGALYMARTRELIRHRDLGAITALCGICCVLALFWPFVTKGLYLSAWIQVGAIFLSVLFGASARWFGESRVACGSLVAILLSIFLFLR